MVPELQYLTGFLQMRRSLFGYFCRRCFVSFIKLSFSGVVKLQKYFQAWIAGESAAGYEVINKEQLTDGRLASLPHRV